MKRLYKILILFFIMSCKGGETYTAKQNINQEKKMDTIYKEKQGNISIAFLRTDDGLNVKWKTIVENKSEKELTLYEDLVEKNFGWKQKESVGESPIKLYNISGTFVDNNKLYVVYNKFGVIFIEKYNFKDHSFTKESKLLSEDLMNGSLGDMINKTKFIKIENDLFFYTVSGQSYSKSNIFIYRLSLQDFKKIKAIQWNENPKKIKVFFINEFGKGWYSDVNKKMANPNNISNDDIKTFNILNDFIKNKKEFDYKEMSLNEDKYKAEEAELKNMFLDDFPLFINDNKDIDYGKISNSEKYINHLNSKINNKKSNLILINYLYDDFANLIYFFFKEGASIKIIRFSNNNSEWIIGDYKEEERK